MGSCIEIEDVNDGRSSEALMHLRLLGSLTSKATIGVDTKDHKKMIQVYSMTRKDSANEHSDSRTIGSARLGSSSYSTVQIDVFAIVQGCGIAVHMLELEESGVWNVSYQRQSRLP